MFNLILNIPFMLFNSWPYFFLLLSTFFIYYASAFRSLQISTLIVASFIFYAYSNPWLLTLLIFSIALNCIVSYYITRSGPTQAKFWAVLGVVVNLAVLAFFKYTPLIADSLSENWRHSDGLGHFLTQIPLPIGISFFTFQGISLTIDVFKERTGPVKSLKILSFHDHLLKTAFFKAFFPQLIAGPIVKAHDFYPQIKPKYFSDIRWKKSIELLIFGYFLKVVLADNLKEQTFWISYPYFQTLSSVDLIVMLVGYSCQIFADFCGYSLIALGSAELFGYELIRNFNWPYISRSFSEFWTRWHISLSSFLKEYLYIPLGGNRKGPLRTYFNLFIVMFLGGLWHGAAWSYAVWGTAHGVLLILERLVSGKLNQIFSWVPETLRQAFQISFVLCCVTFIWLLFRLPHFHEAKLYVLSIFSHWHIPMGKSRILLNAIYCTPVFAMHAYVLMKERWGFQLADKWKWSLYAVMFYCILTNSGNSSEFIYFQF